MRLLILGGTAFLGRAVAHAAITAGHDVTCAARGVTGAAPAGAKFVHIDRGVHIDLNADNVVNRIDNNGDNSGNSRTGGPYDAIDGQFDAVVDVSSRPSHVRAAAAALAERVAHWVYVSSASVYTDSATPGQRAGTAPIEPAAPPEVDDPFADGYTQYGPCKVACEEAVRDTVGAGRAFICRAGLIIGPEDTSGRFTYWPVRLARGGEVLVPGAPDDPVQWIDVRDLAEWLVHAAAGRVCGTYDGIGAPVPRSAFLAGVAAGVDADPATRYTYVGHEFPATAGVNPWAGPRSLPLWLPLPEYAGFLARDVTGSLAAGLAARPLADSARATLAWHARLAPIGDQDFVDEPPAGGPPRREAGLAAEDEAELLRSWHALSG